MNNIKSLTLAALLLTALAVSAADMPTPTTDQGIRVARFKADREAALSFTLDDGWEDNATIAAPLFDRYGFHATFFLVPGVIPLNDNEKKPINKYGQISWDRWKQIAQAGHEIANHTLHHLDLTKSSDEVAQAEIDGGRELIAQKIGITPVSFAYPGNHRDDRVRKFVYARHAVAREFETGYGRPGFTTGKANQLVDKALAEKRWMVAMLHAIVDGYAAFSSASILEEHLKHVQTLNDRLWVDTFGNVGRYVKERDAAKLSVNRDATSATIILTTGLDASLFNLPLTVVIEHVQAVTAEARREGESAPLPVTIAADRLLVELAPGAVPVTIRWRTK
jgi:peptidoglycan/xylan/chitin deacetylase (PgdA/CDA1 family)